MATRPIFIAQTSGETFVHVQTIEFTWHAGMAMSRKKMSMHSLHEAAQAQHPQKRILEVSRMSDTPLGEQLSAFNLMLQRPDAGQDVAVECAFQAAKVFEGGGPFIDLLNVSPFDAKKDPRLKASGNVIGFHHFGDGWPTMPRTAFYDWIYIQALHRNAGLASAVLEYDIFTDIAFNPKKSINCQANAVTLYVSLSRRGLLERVLGDREYFLRIEGTGIVPYRDAEDQGSLFQAMQLGL